MVRNQRDENHLAGDGLTLSNASVVVTFDGVAATALGCTGITVSTIASWMRVVNQESGEKYFIPMWR